MSLVQSEKCTLSWSCSDLAR